VTYQELRAKYPRFIFRNFVWQRIGSDLKVTYNFETPPDHYFKHQMVFKDFPSGAEPLHYQDLLFHIGLSLMPSYWKATCSPIIEIQAGALASPQIPFWEKLFIKGMGEYFYQNQIDFAQPKFLNIISAPPSPELGEGIKGEIPKKTPNLHNKVLIPLGGGKDSIVTLELLKKHYDTAVFMLNPTPSMLKIPVLAGVDKVFIVQSIIDPYLLELNRQGYLNGHVPFSAFLSFVSLFIAAATDCSHIALSNERSSEEGNTEYLGYTINHQYSKTLEFETDLNRYIAQSLNLSITYLSFLRPLYELQITKLFSLYPLYFPVFTSCNRNFMIDPARHPGKGLWCRKCPKCVSLSLLLTPFIGKKKVMEIMGGYPLDLPINQVTINKLTGKLPVKPFECVLTRAEAQAALEIIQFGQSDQLDQLLSSYFHNPNLPFEFEDILKANYAGT